MSAELMPWAASLGLPLNVFVVITWAALLMLVGTVLRGIRASVWPNVHTEERIKSLASWWSVFAMLVFAVLAGRIGIALLISAASLYGLWEYQRLMPRAVATQGVWILAFALAAGYYVGLYLEWKWTAFPVVALAVLCCWSSARGRTTGYIRSVAYPFLAIMLIVYCFSYLLIICFDRNLDNDVAGSLGLFLFVVLLTELNDIAQANWGRMVGRRRITPHVSPNKTWEGFVLGIATTVGFSVPLAQQLTPLKGLSMALAGLVIGIAGFFGDIAVSAIKRDCGAKDSGGLLPGHGGVLDRIDSLTLAAPAFYYYILALQQTSILTD